MSSGTAQSAAGNTAHSARRELALVFALATCGIALVMLVAFAPWYEPVVHPGTAAVVSTYPPVAADLAVARAR
jgi:hypothetical protein